MIQVWQINLKSKTENFNFVFCSFFTCLFWPDKPLGLVFVGLGTDKFRGRPNL